jgi:lactate permease
MLVLLAASPVLVVLIGMIGLKKSAMIVGPVAMVYSLVAAGALLQTPGTILFQSVQAGVIEGLQIIALIYAAFTMLTMMTGTGAMDRIQEIIVSITNDKRLQVVLISMMLGIFLEGAAGAGTPAAIAAPFLVGLGFDPIVAASASLICNSVPVSWGGAGVTTIMGSAGVSEYMSIAQASSMAGRIHMVGAIALPFLLITAIFGRKSLKGITRFLFYAGIVTSISVFLFSNFVGPEVTSMSTGLVGILAMVLLLRRTRYEIPAEYLYVSSASSEIENDLSPAKALSPYVILLVMLPVVRYSFPLAVLTKYGYTVWVACVIMISAYTGSLVLRTKVQDFFKYMVEAFIKVIPALVAMSCLLAMSKVMVNSGMMRILAEFLASLGRSGYPFMAVAVGTLGAFMTGTCLGSNIMFGPMHMEAATSLMQNPITVFAGQNAGGAIGNMICPHNVISVATTVDQLGKEGVIMQKVIPSWFVLFALYGLLALFYTHYLFAGYGIGV